MESSITLAPDLATRLERIGRHTATLESPEFTFGDWAPTEHYADGSISMPWYQPSPAAEAFLTDAAALVQPFDWPAWAESAQGKRLLGKPAAVAAASAEELGMLLTTYIRAERFGDGNLAAAFDSGMLTAIARRASVLALELRG